MSYIMQQYRWEQYILDDAYAAYDEIRMADIRGRYRELENVVTARATGTAVRVLESHGFREMRSWQDADGSSLAVLSSDHGCLRVCARMTPSEHELRIALLEPANQQSAEVIDFYVDVCPSIGAVRIIKVSYVNYLEHAIGELAYWVKSHVERLQANLGAAVLIASTDVQSKLFARIYACIDNQLHDQPAVADKYYLVVAHRGEIFYFFDTKRMERVLRCLTTAEQGKFSPLEQLRALFVTPLLIGESLTGESVKNGGQTITKQFDKLAYVKHKTPYLFAERSLLLGSSAVSVCEVCKFNEVSVHNNFVFAFAAPPQHAHAVKRAVNNAKPAFLEAAAKAVDAFRRIVFEEYLAAPLRREKIVCHELPQYSEFVNEHRRLITPFKRRFRKEAGIPANEETGQVELLAAGHEECGDAWAIPAGLQLRAEALLLQAAQELGRATLATCEPTALAAGSARDGDGAPPDASAFGSLGANVTTLVDQAKQHLHEAMDRWHGLRDPEPTEDNNFVHPETGEEYNYRAAETWQIVQDLARGVLTRYPLRPMSKPTLESEEQIVSTKPAKVFFSYAHEDEGFKDELVKHLSILKRQSVIETWHDRLIAAGQEWQGEIDNNLEQADIILLLVSADFLASDYCWDIEMKRALERHDAGEARVIPIVLRSVDWHGAPFVKLQALPKDAKPVTEWADQDTAFADIAKGIRGAVENP